MAETVAAAASVAGLASLAIQLTESVSKLRRFYRSVRNAPDTSEELIDELETVALALREVERECTKRDVEGVSPDLLARCVRSCERRAKRLQGVVDKMVRSQTRSRGLGNVHVALKEEDQQDILEDLDRTTSQDTIYAYSIPQSPAWTRSSLQVVETKIPKACLLNSTTGRGLAEQHQPSAKSLHPSSRWPATLHLRSASLGPEPGCWLKRTESRLGIVQYPKQEPCRCYVVLLSESFEANLLQRPPTTLSALVAPHFFGEGHVRFSVISSLPHAGQNIWLVVHIASVGPVSEVAASDEAVWTAWYGA